MKFESLIAGFVIFYAATCQLYLFYVHNQLAEFIDYANKNKDALKLEFHVPDFYFPFHLVRCHYGFAIYMCKMKKLPEKSSKIFSNYATMRRLACTALFSHIFLGVILVFLLIFHQVAREM